jgi:glycosyltransferase involved in cell wall biosynthesis
MTDPSTTQSNFSETAPPPARLSIALCTYNGDRFLRHQLDSFVAQSRRPDELVVCDDGSADGTVAMLERFAREAPFRVHVIRNAARLGPTKNFEKAIGLCTGDLIATGDQDDVWLPDKLALSVAAIETAPRRGLIFTNADIVEEDLRPRGHPMWDAISFGPAAQRRVRQGFAFEVLLRQWVVTGATMMFRSEFRPCVLPIPEQWTHDGWIALIVSAMAPIGMIADSTVRYRQHAAQQIGGKKLGWRELYQLARMTGPPYFRLAHERHVLARERLYSLAARMQDKSYLERIDRKVAHQKRRLAIAESPSRAKRILWALDELRRGGYRQFAPSTVAHVVKDMLL